MKNKEKPITIREVAKQVKTLFGYKIVYNLPESIKEEIHGQSLELIVDPYTSRINVNGETFYMISNYTDKHKVSENVVNLVEQYRTARAVLRRVKENEKL